MASIRSERMRMSSERMRGPSIAKVPSSRTLVSVPPATVSRPTMRLARAATGIMICSASIRAAPVAARFSMPMSFMNKRLALNAYCTVGVANAPSSTSCARRPLPERFSASAEGRSSTKPRRISSKLLSDRSTTPFALSRKASEARLPVRSTARSASVPVMSTLRIGPSSAAVCPSNSRETRVGPRTVKVPSRAATPSRAKGVPARSAARRPSHSAQLPRPCSCTRNASSSPASAATTPPWGALSSSASARRFASGTASRTSRMRSPPPRPSPASVRPASCTCARPFAMCASPAKVATCRTPVTGASATKRSILNVPISMSRSGSSGSSSGGVSANSGRRCSVTSELVNAVMSTWLRR